jgi:uncharacterized protein
MKSQLRFFSLSLIITFLSFSVSVHSQIKPETQTGLLWEISGKGLKESSYLFGTYHLVGKSFLDTLPQVINQIKKVKTVVGELVMEDEASMAQKLMPLMLLKDNTLDKILSAREFAEVDSFLKIKTGMTLSMLNGLKPSAVQVTLIAFLLPNNITPQNPALDMYFQNEAKSLKINVVGLETLEEQGAFLFDAPIERQKELLLKTVRESERMKGDIKELFENYRRQDLKAIESAFLKNEDYTVQEMNDLLSKRNKAWVREMPELMINGPAFFAVGAGHLVGDNGLITLLRNLGYTLNPIALK